jgi:FtsP/CotA-like multicopper oxidase with cupredoxin domain
MALKGFPNGKFPPLPFFRFRVLIEGIVDSSGIPPGEQFDYVVPINSSGQWGTYWVHAHSSVIYLPQLDPPNILNNAF